MIFWIALAAITAAGLVFVLRPLLVGAEQVGSRDAYDAEIYRDQLLQIDKDLAADLIDGTEAEAARIEVSRRLLARADGDISNSDGDTEAASWRRGMAVVVIVAVPALALGLYLAEGTPGLPGSPFAGRMEQAIEERDLSSLIAQVEAHLRQHPDDARGWRVIAPAYLEEQRFSDAANAFAQVMNLDGRDAETLTSYAEAVVLAEGGLITEGARAAFEDALSLDAGLLRARFYLGLAARQDGRVPQAVAIWEEILSDADAEATFRPFVEAHVAEAREAMGSAPELSDEEVQDAQSMSPEDRLAMIEGMVAGLAERLDSNPDDIEGWLRLINAYVVLGRREDAVSALSNARDVFAEDAGSLARLDQLAEHHELQEG